MGKGRISAEAIASSLSLGTALARLGADGATYVDHWQQGEFHHDHVFAYEPSRPPEAGFVVVSANCNAGVKEVLLFAEEPDRWALWHWRCPSNPEFQGEIPPILGQARTIHYFDPCELLIDDARSELRPEFRRRQRGGGWEPV